MNTKRRCTIILRELASFMEHEEGTHTLDAHQAMWALNAIEAHVTEMKDGLRARLKPREEEAR